MHFFKVFFISIFFLTQAHALFLFNPYAGKSNGDFVEGTTSGTVEISHFGAHAAYQHNIFTLGLDLSYNLHNFSKNFMNANQSSYKGWEWGVLMGIATQGFRLWSAVNLSSLRMPDGNDGFYFGTNVKIGVGFKVAGGVFLNIESYKNIYDEQEVNNGVTQKLSNNIKMDGVMISISVPTYN